MMVLYWDKFISVCDRDLFELKSFFENLPA